MEPLWSLTNTTGRGKSPGLQYGRWEVSRTAVRSSLCTVVTHFCAVWSPSFLLDCWAIAESFLDCCVVAPFAPWSPPLQSGRPLRSRVAPYAVWSPLLLFLCLRSVYEGCTLLPCVNHVCHVISRVFLGITLLFLGKNLRCPTYDIFPITRLEVVSSLQVGQAL